MAVKIKQRSLLILSLLVISLLASGCIQCAWVPSTSPTPTSAPAVTPTPQPSATTAPTVTPAPAVTATPTPLPSITPVPDPVVVQPGWPNYGVNQTLNMYPPEATPAPTATPSPTPTPTPTGSIFGTLTGYSPVVITAFEINATADGVTYHTSPVDSDGNYLLDNLTYGTYEISYYNTGPGPSFGTTEGTMVTINSTYPNVEYNIVMGLT